MSNYSRQNKKSNKDSQETGKASHHIKKGLSAFQKTLTLIGSIFGWELSLRRLPLAMQ